MERIDPAHLAEEVPRSARMELVLDERIFTSEQLEFALMHFHHQRILPRADRAIARCQLRKIGFDLEPDSLAVARAGVGARFSHGERWYADRTNQPNCSTSAAHNAQASGT